MGSAISRAANGLGGVIGNAFTAPFKSILGGSCEDICSGPWDVICSIEHLCVSSLVKLWMIFVLCYITLLFFYLLFKPGICQCIGRNLCKMCWVACATYWFALEDITCFLWHKLIHTRRVYHRRHRVRDVELGYSSSSTDESDLSRRYRKQKSSRDQRRDERLRSSFYLSRSRGHGHDHNHHRHHLPLARLKGRSRRRVQLICKARIRHRKAGTFKRQRLEWSIPCLTPLPPEYMDIIINSLI